MMIAHPALSTRQWAESFDNSVVSRLVHHANCLASVRPHFDCDLAYCPILPVVPPPEREQDAVAFRNTVGISSHMRDARARARVKFTLKRYSQTHVRGKHLRRVIEFTVSTGAEMFFRVTTGNLTDEETDVEARCGSNRRMRSAQVKRCSKRGRVGDWSVIGGARVVTYGV